MISTPDKILLLIIGYAIAFGIVRIFRGVVTSREDVLHQGIVILIIGVFLFIADCCKVAIQEWMHRDDKDDDDEEQDE